jgi:hypothetical protein
MMPYSTFLMMKSMHVFPWRAISLARKWSVIFELRRKVPVHCLLCGGKPFLAFQHLQYCLLESVSARVPLARSPCRAEIRSGRISAEIWQKVIAHAFHDGCTPFIIISEAPDRRLLICNIYLGELNLEGGVTSRIIPS